MTCFYEHPEPNDKPPTVGAEPPVCPHCELPAVLPETCTPELHEAIERNIARDWDLFNQGWNHAKRTGVGAEPPADPWQPIETAPKDHVILVHDDGYVGKALWQDDGWLDLECDRPQVFYDPPPQHWMPLPAPPGAASPRVGAPADDKMPPFINPGGPTSRCRICHYPLPCGCVAIESAKDNTQRWARVGAEPSPAQAKP